MFCIFTIEFLTIIVPLKANKRLSSLDYFIFVWTRCTMLYYALCLSYHSNTEVVLFVCLSSSWATTTGRLLGPKVGNNIKCFSQGHTDALLPHRESNHSLATFRLLVRPHPSPKLLSLQLNKAFPIFLPPPKFTRFRFNPFGHADNKDFLLFLIFRTNERLESICFRFIYQGVSDFCFTAKIR